jgi:hypothetical protein
MRIGLLAGNRNRSLLISLRLGCGSSRTRRLEQLNRIAVGIFNLNLFAAWAYLHFISKMQTSLFQLGNARR